MFVLKEIAKEIIKPIDTIDEKVIDLVEGLSSPLKKVCCQCNRVFNFDQHLFPFQISIFF